MLIRITKGIPKRLTGMYTVDGVASDLTALNNFGIWLVYTYTGEVFAKYAYDIAGLIGFNKLEYTNTGTDGRYDFIIQPSQTENVKCGIISIVFKRNIIDAETDPDLLSETGFLEETSSLEIQLEIVNNNSSELL